MKTLAFKSTVENNKLTVPDELFAEMKDLNHKEVRVILMMEEAGEFDEQAFKEFARLFFTKYAKNIESFKKLIEQFKE